MPLMYDISMDTTNMQNVLLVAVDANNLAQYSNSNTFSIIYHPDSSRDELLTLLQSKFTTISRIAIAFHYSGDYSNFLNREPFFTQDDLSHNDLNGNYSANVQFIISLIGQFNITYIDYLACNTLQNSNWVNYYNILLTTGIKIGASNDDTGNIAYGGDWIMARRFASRTLRRRSGRRSAH